MICVVPRTWNRLRVEGHYEFNLELKEKLAATRRKADEEEEEEEEVRNWTSASCEPRLVSQVNGITASSGGQSTDSER